MTAVCTCAGACADAVGILLTFATAVLPDNDELIIRKPFEIARR